MHVINESISGNKIHWNISTASRGRNVSSWRTQRVRSDDRWLPDSQQQWRLYVDEVITLLSGVEMVTFLLGSPAAYRWSCNLYSVKYRYTKSIILN